MAACGESYDAVVVGSGYGGSVAACRMSMAGVNVCLLEKGRRWEAKDFPTDVFSLLKTVKIEWLNWGISLGSDQALFQIHEEGDSLAAVACGLGGGSLINAGVILPTPLRARRDPKWPEEWNTDWEKYQLLASSMLGAQSSPLEFPNGRIIKQIVCEEIEDYKPDPIKLSINFDRKEEDNSLVGKEKLESCLACGNCLSGCPYNAKNSTDKNYLAVATKAGCAVKTGRKVQYIVKNSCGVHQLDGKNHQRRWRLYLDDLEYISADFVVLSAGVLGTAEILFKSQRRGLSLSERLGLGLSCNGNNVAYVARSRAPLHAHGLNKNQFSEVPFQLRPGPAISSSFTSSAGFTIQGGVIPTAYPNLIFKGLVAYGWPSCYWFLHGLIDKLKYNIMRSKATQDMVLNVTGHDSSDGRITFDDEAEKIRITAPHDPLLPKKILALQNLTRKLGGILFMSRYRSTCVHLLGGCNAATNSSLGVCNSKGQVFNPINTNPVAVHEGLYVSDASLIPCSVGTNPCLTITALSERIGQALVDDVIKFKSKVRVKETNQNMDSVPTLNGEVHGNMWSDKVVVKETMRGFIGGMPCTAYLTMNMNCRGKEGFVNKSSFIGDSHSLLKGRVGGYVVFKSVSKEKLFILDGEVDLCEVDSRTPYTQYMHYGLTLASTCGSRYILEGKKVMNPFFLSLYAWHESTTLHVTFRKVEIDDIKDHKQHNGSGEELLSLQGELTISTFELLRSLASLKGKQRGKFVLLLLQSFWRTYISQVPRYTENDSSSSEMNQVHYPPYNLHSLKTEDGYTISCKQWRSTSTQGGRSQYPVLLLNGYSGESYCLPTEKRDLVRILLEEGYDTWLLQTRLHPLHPSNNFTIEDIGKFDIPAVIGKIVEVNGPLSRIHVIAHCVGGLAIHIALLGGHVPASRIASLSCTNSSMYFKLTKYALLKMKLPLLPVTMAILGRNTTLSITDNSKDEFRHSLLKSIAMIIPRTERCISDECNIFSGVFGNAFLHSNISKTLHQWLIKENITHLPMSGFPHLRKICNAGFIVDAEGKSKYLIHSERMALPTLYVSGGKSLLVTQETSFLANRYMKLHQPGFEHKRVVVEGFGHSDLLIGKKSYKNVFPHFLSHMRMVEGGGGRKVSQGSEISWEAFFDRDGGSKVPAFFIFLLALFFFFWTILYI